jgi:hypothetical protein
MRSEGTLMTRQQAFALYQGTTFSRAVKALKELGFSPCAVFNWDLFRILQWQGLKPRPFWP